MSRTLYYPTDSYRDDLPHIFFCDGAADLPTVMRQGDLAITLDTAKLYLAANTIYFIAVAVNATGTTAGVQCQSATTGRIGVLPTAWPGNLDIDMASPKLNAIGFCQFAITAGALPTPANTLAAQAAWAGGMPAFFLDNNNG